MLILIMACFIKLCKKCDQGDVYSHKFICVNVKFMNLQVQLELLAYR